MRARILTAFVLVAAFVLALVELPLGITYASRQEERLLADMERDARILASLVEEQVEAGDVGSVTSTLQQYESRTGGRVLLTDDAGRTIVDSEPGVALDRDYSTRPEIAAALAGSQLSGVRASDTLGGDIAFVAVPIATSGKLGGVVRVTFPTDILDRQVRANWLQLALLSAFVLAAAAALGWIVASWVLRPIRQLQAATDRLAQGDLDARLDLEHGPPELVELASRFDGMADRLAALVASRDAFVADASHQLRTPLTALRLRLDLLEDVAGEDPEVGTELEAISDEVDRLAAMVEGLLELARTSGGDHRIVEVDLTAAATAAAARWGPLAAERGVEVNVAVDDGGAVAVRAVDGAVEQILDNLVDNAIEASPAGSAIDIDVHRSGGDVASLEVRDRGPGLDPASRHRAFDRFWRAGNATPGGSGLGLAIVAELARRSGGDVELTDPADGPGLLARVGLPSWTPSGRSD